MNASTPNLERRVALLEGVMTSRFPKSIHAQRLFIVETIQNFVCEEFNLRLAYLNSDRRIASLCWPRHIAMALSYEYSGVSSKKLAPLFNRDDHATILHAVKTVRSSVATNKLRAADVQRIRERIKAALGL